MRKRARAETMGQWKSPSSPGSAAPAPRALRRPAAELVALSFNGPEKGAAVPDGYPGRELTDDERTRVDPAPGPPALILAAEGAAR